MVHGQTLRCEVRYGNRTVRVGQRPGTRVDSGSCSPQATWHCKGHRLRSRSPSNVALLSALMAAVQTERAAARSAERAALERH
eukprot:4333844-Prymnesium_polylepis.1